MTHDPDTNPSEAGLKISVVIPTLNRKPLLLKTLEALRTQLEPPYEVVVVDNGSSDGTAEAVSSSGLGHVVSEPVRGPAAARNRGITEVAGDIIAFLDDDAVPAPDWTAVMARFFKESGAAGAGGPAIADWEGGAPPWYVATSKKLRSYIGVFDLGHEVKRLESYYDFLIGANCAFRREVFDSGARFAHFFVGRPGTSEDLEFSRRVATTLPVYYLPGMKVFHYIAMRKYSPVYILATVFDCGLKKPFIKRRLCPRGPADLWGIDGVLSFFSFMGYLSGSLLLLLCPGLRRERERMLGGSGAASPALK